MTMNSEKITVKVDSDLKSLIPGFLKNRYNDVQSLRAALRADDFEQLRFVGHSLKGVGGGYGFDEITEFGATIEQAAKEGNKSLIEVMVSKLSDYLQRLEVVYN